MPLGAIAGAGLGAGMSILNTYLQGRQQNKLNQQTQAWNEKMFDLQNQQSEKFWHMQNQYNSPLSQMQRYQEAGLNPNLIYGQQNTGATMSPGSPGSWKPENPWKGLDLTSGIMAYADFKNKAAQTDNLKAQNTVLAQEAANKAADTAWKASNTARSDFDLDMAKSLRENSLEAAAANLRNTETSTLKMEQDMARSRSDQQLGINRDVRDAAMQSSNLREAIYRIMKIKADMANTDAERAKILQQTKNLELDSEIKQDDLRLRKRGIHPGDNEYWRILDKHVPDLFMKGKNVVDDYWKDFARHLRNNVSPRIK